MATVDNVWYVNGGDGSTTGYYAIGAWATGAAKSVGALIRQTSAAVNAERVFVCIIAGTTHGTTEPTWTMTRGAKTTDNDITWQECTGQPAVCGDVSNTVTWAAFKAVTSNVSLGQIVTSAAETHYFICTTAGAAIGASEPTWDTTAGNTTADGNATWTCLGVIGGFSAWGAPFARLGAACASTWGGVSDIFFVSDTHAETQAAANTITFPGARITQNHCLCIDSAAALPPTSADIITGASITTTGANVLTVAGNVVVDGFTLSSGSGAVTTGLVLGATANYQTFKNCTLKKPGTASNVIAITGSTAGTYAEWINTTVEFGHANDCMRGSGVFIWRDTPAAVQGATIPTKLFSASANATKIVISGVDFSALGAGKILSGGSSGACHSLFVNCKLGAGVTLSDNAGGAGYNSATFINCDSAGTNYLSSKYDGETGTQSTETTIVRTGGASDGVTPYSWKIVTTATSSWPAPFECIQLRQWNDVTAANVTVTVYGIWGGGAVPNNDDIWMEVSYLGSSATPVATILRLTKTDILASNAAHSSDGSTWGGSTTAFKMTAVLSAPQPAMKGLIYVIVKCAKASTTFYIDPVVNLS